MYDTVPLKFYLFILTCHIIIITTLYFTLKSKIKIKILKRVSYNNTLDFTKLKINTPYNFNIDPIQGIKYIKIYFLKPEDLNSINEAVLDININNEIVNLKELKREKTYIIYELDKNSAVSKISIKIPNNMNNVLFYGYN